MGMRERSIVLVSLLMVVAVAGCATNPDTHQPSAAASTYGASDMAGQYGVGAGAHAAGTARPRLSDFVVNDAVRDVHFEFDSYTIRPADVKVLEATTQWLKTHPGAMLVIEGHADERGTNEYNVALGERRAKATMNYLVSHGIGAMRIIVTSYGEERGVCAEHAEPCWSRNRRAHFLVKLQ
jgi:peptidoglycan-associated lipoprotein